MKHIVIIENDEATRFLLQTVLVEGGYEAIPIEGPGDLLAKLRAATPDLVLLDLMLGTWGDGLVLAAGIRREPCWEGLPVIAISAAHTVLRQHADELVALGCHVLEKPFDLDVLYAIIERELASVQS
jgi:DNA-binding response OmpR family regulator